MATGDVPDDARGFGHRLGRLVGLHRGARREHLRTTATADTTTGAIRPTLLLAQRHVQTRSERSAQHRVERLARDAVALLARRRHPCRPDYRSEEHTSELQSLMRSSYAVFCLKK